MQGRNKRRPASPLKKSFACYYYNKSPSHVSGRAEGKNLFFSCFFRLLPVSQSLCSHCAGFCAEVASFPVVCVGFSHGNGREKIFFEEEDEAATNVIVKSNSNLQGRAGKVAGTQTSMYLTPVSIVGPLRLLCPGMSSSSSAPGTPKTTPQPGAAWVCFLMAKAEAGQPKADILQEGSGYTVLGRIRALDALGLGHPLQS